MLRDVARERYSSGARLYDAVSAEWPVYRIGRTTAIERLDPRPGERVLDLGYGTGLNHALLDAAVGPDGAVLGVDRSAAMLAVAGFGGADLDARPRRMIETGARGVSGRGLRGGHIQMRVGALPTALRPGSADPPPEDEATTEEPAA